jgi:glycosyltransferase involved in cell wall biosynthesis
MASPEGPTVAVIIPFYNGKRWIERAIRSVVEQTVKPSEFVIVNDGSKPEEREILPGLAERYGFRIIDKENGGQGSARNAGVWATTAEFVAFLDQDDFFLPQHIEDLLLTIPKNDARLGYVYADVCGGDEHGYINHSNLLRYQTREGRHPKQGSAAELISQDMFVLPSASLIKRTAFTAVGGFDEQFIGYEDDDLFLRIYRNGYTNHYLDKPVTVWRRYGGSASYTVKMSHSRFKYFKKLSVLFEDEPEYGLYYFRDCLISRFGQHFLDEPIRARDRKSPDLNALIEILRQYGEIIDRNPTVSSEYKDTVRKRLAELLGTCELSPVAHEETATVVSEKRLSAVRKLRRELARLLPR